MANKTSTTIERKEDGTIHLQLTIPHTDIQKATEDLISNTVNTAEITGFRKGKAPRSIVEQTLDKGKLKEEILKKLLPPSYVSAVEENNLKPIMNPKIHVDTLPDDKDWSITAITCEMPVVKLNKYKDEIKKVTAKSKIILPGKDQKKQEPSLDEVVKALLTETSVAIPSILIEQEVDRLLAQTLDEIKRLGLTLDQYLSSTNKKPEELRAEYAMKAENDIKLEFVLQTVAESEKITIEDKEITEAIQKAKDPIEKENLQKNSYMLASILRQQKTLDFLKNL
jgi:FKBP-type peptidyl-prolyl cis-trans isomerase (trigger factor)